MPHGSIATGRRPGQPPGRPGHARPSPRHNVHVRRFASPVPGRHAPRDARPPSRSAPLMTMRWWRASRPPVPTSTRRPRAPASPPRPVVAALPLHERSRILREVSAALRERRETFARCIVQEAGKPLRDARTEVDRAAMTFEVAAEEARRLPGAGEVVPMDLAAARRGPLRPHAARAPRSDCRHFARSTSR